MQNVINTLDRTSLIVASAYNPHGTRFSHMDQCVSLKVTNIYITKVSQLRRMSHFTQTLLALVSLYFASLQELRASTTQRTQAVVRYSSPNMHTHAMTGRTVIDIMQSTQSNEIR
jgi:hypothetical protein